MTGGTPLRSLDEDELLARILPAIPGGRRPPRPPGDDAAVLVTSERIIATTDTVVLGRDWLDAWSSGADIGHKVVAQNLADVAAMGGRPTGVLVTLVADPELSLEWVLDHVRGLAEACAAAGVAVLGGDLSSAPAGVVMVSVTALGRLDGDPVLRSGARAGDVLAVHGSLGLADAGLRLLKAEAVDRLPVAVERQRRPQPPLAAGPEAAAAGATAMLDISDGLLRDGGRIARASHVVIDLDLQALADDVEALTGRSGPRQRSTACSPAARSTRCSRPSRRARCRTAGGRSGPSGRRRTTSLPASSWAAATSATRGGTTSATADRGPSRVDGMPRARSR